MAWDRTIRDRIADAALTTLSAAWVSGDPGPAKPAGLNVHRERTRAIESEGCPAILVYLEDEDQRPISSRRRSPLTERNLVLGLELRALGSATLSPDKALDPLYMWAMYRIFLDESLGGLVNDIDEVKTRWNSKQGDLALASQTTLLAVKYRTDRIDPSSRG